jgi:hypothetical protein
MNFPHLNVKFLTTVNVNFLTLHPNVNFLTLHPNVNFLTMFIMLELIPKSNQIQIKFLKNINIINYYVYRTR